MSQPTKLKEVGELKSVLTLDMEMQSLEFPSFFWSYFSPVFPPFAPSLQFGMVMCILYHYMLEVCDMFFILFYRRLQLDYMNLRSDFELWTLNIVEAVIDIGTFGVRLNVLLQVYGPGSGMW